MLAARFYESIYRKESLDLCCIKYLAVINSVTDKHSSLSQGTRRAALY